MKDSFLLGAFFTFMGIVILVCVCGMAYEEGQFSILYSCEHTSFFYMGHKTFECLPYHRGMLENEIRARPHPELPPQ